MKWLNNEARLGWASNRISNLMMIRGLINAPTLIHIIFNKFLILKSFKA